MIPLTHLERAAREGLEYLRTVPDVREAEVFVASNGNLIARLNYTSHIPSNGVEEPKSTESFGVGLRVAFDTRDGVRTGFGSEPSDLSLEGVKRALEKAQRGAVRDPEFVSLPRPASVQPRRTIARYHDPNVMRMRDGQLVDAGWQVVEGGLEAFQSAEELLEWAHSPQAVNDLGLILTGDVMVLQERMALAGTHFPRVLTDESTLIASFATAMVESQFAKGSGWSVGSHLANLSGDPGAEAARNAVRSAGGICQPYHRLRGRHR